MFNPADPWAEVSTLSDMLRSLRVIQADAAYLGNAAITTSIDVAVDEIKAALDEAQDTANRQNRQDLIALERQYQLGVI